MDRQGNVVLPPKFGYAGAFSCGLAVVRVNKQYGYIDQTFTVTIEPSYTSTEKFSEMRAVVEMEGLVGVIDTTGRKIIKFGIYSRIYSFHDGLAMVEADTKFGFVDSSGTAVVAPQFERAHAFSEGLSWVETGGKFGAINKNGEFVLQPEFDWALPFSEGVAAVRYPKRRDISFIDRTGRTVIDRADIWEANSFSEGLAAVRVKNEWKYMDKEGRQTISLPSNVFEAGEFSEGRAKVWSDEYPEESYLEYIDRTGKIIAGKFDDGHKFEHGLAYVYFSMPDSGYIDRDGQTVWRSFDAWGDIS